jgi:hypothetical protein
MSDLEPKVSLWPLMEPSESQLERYFTVPGTGLSGTMLLDRLLVQLTTEVRNSRDTARSVDPEKSLKILKAKISNDKLAINAIENVLNARNQL